VLVWVGKVITVCMCVCVRVSECVRVYVRRVCVLCVLCQKMFRKKWAGLFLEEAPPSDKIVSAATKEAPISLHYCSKGYPPFSKHERENQR